MHHMGVSSAAAMGARRFFSTGGITQSLVKRDMFRVGDIPILFRGWKTRNWIGSLVPHQCNKSHMLPYFARPLASSSASQSSGQIPRQEPKEEKECQIIRNSQLQRERSCDEISSAKVLLNQFPGLMVHGMVEDSNTRRLLRLNPDTGSFEQEQDVAAGANHDHSQHKELQVPHGHVCRGSAYGWLFLTDDNLDMKLFNPFSGAEIQLPPVKTLPPSECKEDEQCPLSKWFVYKAVLSANPSIEPRPVVLVIYGGQHIARLAFCKPGDERWTPLEFPIKRVCHMDAVYYNGQFYVLSYPGYVTAFDIGRRINDDVLSVKTTLVATAPKIKLIFGRDWYLVVLDGELVRFELRSGCFYDCCIEKTKRRMEEERIRDGDTTDAYGEFDLESIYARAVSNDPETVVEDEDWHDDNSDEDYDFNYADADEDPETEIETVVEDEDVDNFNYADADEDPETEIETVVEDEDDDNDDDDAEKEECRGRFPCVDQNLPPLTYGIKIRRFDVSEQKWVKVESLGDKAVFLGYNTSFVVSASDYPAGHCIPDSVYFTYGRGGNARTEKVCYDMGIYNLKDNSVKRPLYLLDDDADDSEFKKPAPIWILNSVS